MDTRVATAEDLKEFEVPVGSNVSATSTKKETTAANACEASKEPTTMANVVDSPKVDTTIGTFTLSTNGGSLDEDGIPEGGYQPYKYEDAAEMLNFYDDQINNGDVTPHKWQTEELIKLSTVPASSKHPFKYTLLASNGSGKDSFLIAPFSIFMLLNHVKCRVVVTSSSGTQLTAQTETYIKNLAEKVNNKWGERIFKINQRYIKCLKTGSEIRMYATDEAGKAEGYHPIEPNRLFVIIANEAKSITEEIHTALKRCNGYSHFLMISSAGEPIGSLYFAYNHWPYRRRITSYDCPHIAQSDIDDDKLQYGEHSVFFRSKHLSLFTTLGAQVLITQEMADKCREHCISWYLSSAPKRVGIDLAAGGDECVISIWQGGKRIMQYTFVERDTYLSVDIISRELSKNGIPKDSSYIRADDGGIGRGIIDGLVRKGWNITRVLNQWPAHNKREFGNRGAEMWFRFMRLIQECVILLPEDDVQFMSQLTNRHYSDKIHTGGRVFLQTKKDAKAHGYPSPDRVDAAVLAFADLSIEDFLKEKLPLQVVNTGARPATIQDLAELAVAAKHESKWDYFNEMDAGHAENAHLIRRADALGVDRPKAPQPQQRINNSLLAALGVS